MLKRLVRATLLAAALACIGPVATALAATPTYVNDTTNGRWVVYNDDAVWHIYRGCGPNGVGPGYVAFVQMKNAATGAYDGRVLVDDVNAVASDFPAGFTAEDRQIGLGKFVWRHARAAQGATLYYTAAYKNAWPASNRCITETYSPTARSGRLGAGTLTQDAVATGTDQRGAYVEIDQAFPLQDMFSPLLRISYKWRFYARIVRMWSYIETQCPDGTCGGTGAPRAWVKGPRYVAGVNGTVDGTRFTHLQVYDTHGTAVCAYDRSMSGSNSATGQCPANIASYNGSPCANTFEANCPGRDRARVRTTTPRRSTSTTRSRARRGAARQTAASRRPSGGSTRTRTGRGRATSSATPA